MGRELGENFFAGGSGTSEEHLVRTGFDGAAGSLGGFREKRDEMRIEPGEMDDLDKRARCEGAADPGLQKNSSG